MSRIAGWNEALGETIERWRSRERVFGVSDCCQFAADCVRDMTGEDYAQDFHTYASEAQALRLLVDNGGMVGLLSSVLGASKHVSRAKVGDVVAVTSSEGEGCGICLGVQTACMGPSGLVFLPTLDGVAAWSV